MQEYCPYRCCHLFYIFAGCVSLSAIAHVRIVVLFLKFCRTLGPEIYGLVLTFISVRFSEYYRPRNAPQLTPTP